MIIEKKAVVDDHPLVRESLRSLIDREHDREVSVEAAKRRRRHERTARRACGCSAGNPCARIKETLGIETAGELVLKAATWVNAGPPS